MIKTRSGKVLYNETLQEILAKNENLPTTQHARFAGEKIYKFQQADFTNMDLRGMEFHHQIMDGADFTGSDLRGASFLKTGLRNARFHRCQLDGAEFRNCNLREGEVSMSWAPDVTFYSCNMIQVDMRNLYARGGHFEGNDMRKCNLRDTEMTHTLFLKNKARGMITRNAWFSWSTAPAFFHDEGLQYRYMDPKDWVVAYKLTAADARGIYHPKITYKVGKTFDAEQQDIGHVPMDPAKNTGIAVASMSWVLREWNACGAYGDYRLFQCKFQVKDIMENEGVGKFNVRKITITKEIDMKEFYDQMTESIDYHTGTTARDTDIFV